MPHQGQPLALKLLYMLLRILALSYAGICIVMYLFQRHYVYYPAKAERDAELLLATLYRLTPWLRADGELQGWSSAAPGTATGVKSAVSPAVAPGTPAAPVPQRQERWLVFHGNAGRALDRMYLVSLLRPKHGPISDQVQVFVFEYPGYGARPGTASEPTIMAAARAAVKGLLAQPDDGPLYLLGESLGTGVACALAAEFPEQIAGVLLLTPYSNLPDVGRRHFPFLPVRWLMKERYASDAVLPKYPGPVAFVLAEKDEVVTFPSGKKLLDAYPGRKQAWIIQDAGHNGIDYGDADAWWPNARAFVTGGKGP